MNGTPFINASDSPLVIRAYNLGLKVVPNLVHALTVPDLEYWESHIKDIKFAVEHGFSSRLPIESSKPVVTSPTLVIPDTFRVDYSIKGTYPDWMKKRMHPEFDRADTVEYRLDQVKLWLHPDQENGDRIGGKALYQHIKDNKILPTCLGLRDLEEIQKLGIDVFRRYFRGKAVFAWKDVVRSRDGSLYVPYLVENGDGVVMLWYWLGDDWRVNCPAARFAS